MVTAGELRQSRRDTEHGYTHRCTIVRPGDSHSWDGDETETTLYTDLRCRYVERVSRETNDVGGTTVVTTAVLHLPYDTDITESDRVTSVTDPTGIAVVSRDRGITAIARTSDHIEVVLQGSGR